MHDTTYHPDLIYPELYLRVWDIGDDLLAEGDDAADFVLDLRLPDGSAVALPFYKSVEEIAAFTQFWLSTLSGDEFKTHRVKQNGGGVRLRDVMLGSHRFLEEALGDRLGDLVAGLDMIGDSSPVRVHGDGLIPGNFPWGLLHPWPVPSMAALKTPGLLGARFLLVRWTNHMHNAVRAQGMAHDVQGNGPLAYGFVDDDDLPSVQKGVERDALHRFTGAAFDPLHDLAEDQTLSDHDTLVAYLLRSRVSVHFACDGGVGPSGRDAKRYHIRVRQRENVGTTWLRKQIESRRMPDIGSLIGGNNRLLFLNICNSVTKTGGFDKSPDSALEGLRPQAVIGTQGKICDILAADFATDFYERTLAHGHDVGTAFLAAVRQGLATTFNPAHLLFVLKGQPDVRLS